MKSVRKSFFYTYFIKKWLKMIVFAKYSLYLHRGRESVADMT